MRPSLLAWGGQRGGVIGCTPSALAFSKTIVPNLARLTLLRTFGRTYTFTAPQNMGPAYPGLGSSVTASGTYGSTTMNVGVVLLVPNTANPSCFSFGASGTGGFVGS